MGDEDEVERLKKEMDELRKMMMLCLNMKQENRASDGCMVPLPKAINTESGDVSENFKMFKVQWNNYLIANGYTNKPEKEKIATLLIAIGEDCMKIYQSLPLTEEERDTSEKILDVLERNLTPKNNVIHKSVI
jgi:hypothetical protein